MIRRRVAEVAALAVAVAAVVAVSSLTQHQGHKPPAPVTPKYHVTVNPPSPGSAKGLIASGLVNGRRWHVIAQRTPGGACFLTIPRRPSCDGNGLPRASRTGQPADLSMGIGSRPLVMVGTVRSDVGLLRVRLTNGQVLTLRPVPVFGFAHATYIAFAVPSAAAVAQISAYSGDAELARAIPFTGNGFVDVVRWRRPGAPVGSAPATYLIGSGKMNGRTWQVHLYTGPWGTCLVVADLGTNCFQSGLRHATEGRVARLLDYGSAGPLHYTTLATAPRVAYVLVTRANGSTFRVATVRAAGCRFAAFAWSLPSRRVYWTAYSSAGRKLASGRIP